jgi:hypothetical protein
MKWQLEIELKCWRYALESAEDSHEGIEGVNLVALLREHQGCRTQRGKRDWSDLRDGDDVLQHSAALLRVDCHYDLRRDVHRDLRPREEAEYRKEENYSSGTGRKQCLRKSQMG